MAKRAALERARARQGLSRAQFAELIGVSVNMVYSVEVGRRDPSLSLARKWLKKLGPGTTMDLFRPGRGNERRTAAPPVSSAAE